MKMTQIYAQRTCSTQNRDARGLVSAKNPPGVQPRSRVVLPALHVRGYNTCKGNCAVADLQTRRACRWSFGLLE